MTTPSHSLWGGRFASGPDAVFRAINDSLAFDWRLVRQDITGSKAWARALGRADVLGQDEVGRLERALTDLEEEVGQSLDPPFESGAEDVHTWVEQRLVGMLGPLGKKLHTGRSRNDQVATDLRLWAREAIDERRAELLTLQRAFVDLAERELDTPFPGYTHLQRAQPVLLSHWALAHAESFHRDAARFSDARRRANLCPLGSAALAGTAYPIDRAALARELGFEGPTSNSMDAVADRDFVAETLSAAALCAVHLSRLGEELILYSSAEFGLVEMDDAVTSGSSIMPQKKNPDGCELLRGKAGRIIGTQAGFLSTLKGLPFAYNKDLQEDKEAIFDAMDQLSLCLTLAERVVAGCRFARDRCMAAAAGGHANATELADYLVEKGVPFRDAHEQTGRIVREAIALRCGIEDLRIDDLRRYAPAAGEDVYARLTLSAALDKRSVQGGTSPATVRLAVREFKQRLGYGP
ncbi:MAG: argininosuccinate lyase [Phycisphaeraceae bacterium]|nr:argininosuccinate lyase [Phycisphaeraceae bacterium]